MEPRKATNTSHFTGVCWEKPRDKWRAKWKGKWLGYHTMEGDAPRAYNVVEAERLGLTVNVIPPAGAAGEDAGVAGGAARPARPGPRPPVECGVLGMMRRAQSPMGSPPPSHCWHLCWHSVLACPAIEQFQQKG